ncbi:MAG TPA: menaquinone biosynthesis protein [Tepidisphaeraceae bacterium]|nr:menaquinone biosynthesis protein [Tepidisphaeraceae bacterium]
MTVPSAAPSSPRSGRRLRVASVSFLNSKPLIEGLEREPDVDLLLRVPSALLATLQTDQADVALLPVIDYQRAEGLTVLPAGGIGSDGPTLTVRIFSRVPIERIKSLACDPDSHTSVALARIILARRYRLRPECCDLSRASDAADEARLLIGDKVVTAEPRGFEHQLDLGREWKAMTGLPFVFAVWLARPGVALPPLYDHLARAKQRGLAVIERIITRHAVPLGWPVELARQYLTQNLRFHVGPRELDAIRTFHQLAAEEAIIPAAEPLRVWTPAEQA